MKSIFLCENPNTPKWVYREETVSLLEQTAGLCRTVYNKEYILAHRPQFADTEYIFSTWGMSELECDQIRSAFPRLKCVFYAAGSVQYFARPFLECGVRVFSAWAANAVPVAEYTVAQIVLANKGFYQTCRIMSGGNSAQAARVKGKYCGNFGKSVGLIGAGMIGSMVAERLADYRLHVKVFDPFLSDERAAALGVEICGLEELFSTCHVVSNHLANNAQTRGMLKYNHFVSMPEYSTFINTGRGAQVVEDDLVRALTERRDLTAVLDVTDPEPPEDRHKFYSLNNCFLTPHIAGSSGDEVHRMAEYMAEEYRKFAAGGKCDYEVTEKMLITMA